MERISAGDLHLNAELTGPDGAPVVCLNHCFAADHEYWSHHLDAFAGFRILRYDLRGHGGSDAPPGPYSLEQMAGDIDALCHHWNIERVHVVGVSLGGQIAQTFALNYPERLASLVLVNSTCEYTDDQTTMWRERANQALTHGMSAVQPALMQRWFTPEAASNRIPGYRYMERAIGRFSATSFAAASAAMCALDTTERLCTINAPAMVIATPDDPGAPREVSEKMARNIPDCALHWLEPAQHLSSLEHPERFNALVSEFLSKLR
ncbi:MAG: alpha/beta fold hydrolase [Gammaproteobacteria bacterium]|nr:alpha/beta fold hydrolase [Gammaproteobacteria bacterium]